MALTPLDVLFMANPFKKIVDVKTPQARIFFVSGDEGVEKVVEGNFSEPVWGGARCFALLSEALAQRHADTAIVVAFLPPLTWLASLIEQGVPPHEALADWREQTEAMLGACRIARRQIALVDQQALLERPKQVRIAIATRFQLSIESAPAEPTPITFDTKASFHLALAYAVLHEDDVTASLLDELNAMTVGPATGIKMPASLLDDAAMRFDALAKAARDQHEERLIVAETVRLIAARVSTIKEEVLQEQEENAARIRELQSEVRRHVIELSAAKAEAESLRGDLSRVRSKLEEINTALVGLKSETDAEDRNFARASSSELALVAERDRASKAQSLLVEECNRLKEMVFETEILTLVLARREKKLAEELSKSRAQHEQKEAKLDRMLREAREEVRMLRTSTSWKVTRPMRAIGHRLKKRPNVS